MTGALAVMMRDCDGSGDDGEDHHHDDVEDVLMILILTADRLVHVKL